MAIVGAGAAGMTAGIFAARHAPGLRVALLDGAAKPGAKILVAGGGRCNVTNRRVGAADFCGGSRNTIRRVLATLPVERTIEWFAGMGVSLREEDHGKLFPDSNQAHTVLRALLDELQRRGVMLWTGHRVMAVEKSERSGFHLSTSAGDVRAGRVVLATGGESLPKTGSDGGGLAMARNLGHSIVPTVPALVPLVLVGDFHAGLSGVSQEVEIVVAVEGERPVRTAGSLLWTHFGVSGPAVLDASRHWARARQQGRPASVAINMLPGKHLQWAERTLLDKAAAQPRSILRNALGDWLPARVADAVLRVLAIDGRVPLAHLSKEVRRRLLRGLLHWPLPVHDTRGYNHAEVTAGGVALAEVDPATMASRRCPGLYLVGEVLDVDGRIGGFNFQWAWSSGCVAGRALAGSKSDSTAV